MSEMGVHAPSAFMVNWAVMLIDFEPACRGKKNAMAMDGSSSPVLSG